MFVHHSCNNQARNRHRTYSTLPAVTKEAVCNWRENDGKDLHAETNKPRIRNALRIDPTLTLAQFVARLTPNTGEMPTRDAYCTNPQPATVTATVMAIKCYCCRLLRDAPPILVAPP